MNKIFLILVLLNLNISCVDKKVNEEISGQNAECFWENEIEVRYLDHFQKNCLCPIEQFAGVMKSFDKNLTISQIKEIIAKEEKCEVADIQVIRPAPIILIMEYLSEDDKKLNNVGQIWIINIKNKCPNAAKD